MPRFGSMAAECYYSEGNNIFSSYNSTNRNCILNLLPYDEYYALTNTEFSLYLNDDSTINYLSLKDSKTFNDGSTSSSTGRIIKVTYSNINSTTIVDSFVKA
ncbi:unknown [Firmicutes bacterium CAG:449]|nr:unknown [Firmicutes bacterium CAG:449]